MGKTTHGMYGTPTYNTWYGMKTRCQNKNSSAFKYYGKRGIRVCGRWQAFENFLEDMGERPDDLTLDRIDTNGNYCKENCRWVDMKAQNNNSRNNRVIEFNGETKTITAWGESTGLGQHLIGKRLDADWSVKDALTLPPRAARPETQFKRDRSRNNNRWIEYKGKRQILADWAREFSVPISTLHKKIKQASSIDSLFNKLEVAV